jgi:hypothetical protein
MASSTPVFTSHNYIQFLSFSFFQNIDPKYGENMKFRNFAFDVKEFMRIISHMVEQVRKNLREYKDK